MLENLQKQINKTDGLLITNLFNIRFLTGFTGSNAQIFLTLKSAYFFTDSRYTVYAKSILPAGYKLVELKSPLADEINKIVAKENLKIVLFDGSNLTFSQFTYFQKNLKTKFESGQNLVENLRMIKSDQELKLITKAQRLAEETFLLVRQNLRVGKTEKQIAWEIETIGHDLGADKTSIESIMGFGSNSAIPHHQNTDRKLKKGELVLVDMGMQYKGYCSDMTRMVFTATPTTKQKEVYNIVLDAQESAAKKVKAGVIGQAIDKIARDIIDDAGYGETFGHSLGHGIGLEVHESPNLSPNYNAVIPEGTIVTVEPGIYLENSFGVRLEDMVLVKRNGCVNLSKIPKDISKTIKHLS